MKLLDFKVLEKLREIEDVLSNNLDCVTEMGLKQGKLGFLLFFLTLQDSYSKDYGQIIKELFRNVISQAINGGVKKRIQEQFSDLGEILHLIALDAEHLSEFEELLQHIDDIQMKHLQNSFKRRDFDIITGSLCSGYYLLTRYKNSGKFEKEIMSLIYHLDEISYFKDGDKRYWKSEIFSDSRVYLGISHGVISVLLFLFECYKTDIDREKCFLMIEQGVDFIISEEIKEVKKNYFPVIVDELYNGAPIGWCYGDLSIAYSLFRLSEILPRKEIIAAKSIEIISFMCHRNDKSKYVKDAGIVCGASGVATIYLNMYRKTKIKLFQNEYMYWTKYIVDFPKSSNKNSMAGYQSFYSDNDKGLNGSFFYGISGIGLYLIQFLDRSKDDFCKYLYLK